jgi:hypothetical protein
MKYPAVIDRSSLAIVDSLRTAFPDFPDNFK